VWKKLGDVGKEGIKSEVEMGTEINAAIGGRRHRRLPVVFGAAVSFQTDEKQGVKETQKGNG